ncbi:MAG: 6,7-dimethyl-8-ribityllumazine synthase [Thermoplasmata archaeon]|nr:6,7-dimethyl-8-ribityllumazine synthase [Thermoplasmata archaeon]
MAEKIRIGIVVSEFNYDITMMMLERAKAHAEFLGVDIAEIVTMPGVYDMPVAAKKLLRRKDIDGVVALGAVIKGETDHDQIIMQNAARKLADLSVEFEKPVGLGISGPGMTRLQAEDRIENAKNAVESVVKQIRALKGVDK